MKRRRPVPFTDKLHVASKQQWKCQSCKTTLTEFFELDHILPVALGGSNTTHNLQALCSDCHRHKSVFDIRRIRKKAKGTSFKYKIFVYIRSVYVLQHFRVVVVGYLSPQRLNTCAVPHHLHLPER